MLPGRYCKHIIFLLLEQTACTQPQPHMQPLTHLTLTVSAPKFLNGLDIEVHHLNMCFSLQRRPHPTEEK